MDTPTELEFVCANCSWPIITQVDEEGHLIGFIEERGPGSEEEAIKDGWLDHGMGWFCPKCSLAHLEELARELETGTTSGATSETSIGQMFETNFIAKVRPDASPETIEIFTKILRHIRLRRSRKLFGLIPPDPIKVPEPRDEKQAQDFMALLQAIGVTKTEI